MQQAKFSLTSPVIDFLSSYKRYGFKDKSAMVRVALLQLQEELELESLKQSADLYAEVYEEDAELFELTEAAITDADCLQTRPIDHRRRLVGIRGQLSRIEMEQISQALKMIFALK